MTIPLDPAEPDRLRILRGSGLLDAKPSPAIDAICLEAQRHFGVATALVTLLDEDWQTFKAKQGIDLNGTVRELAFCNYTILADAVFVVPDAASDPRFAQNLLVTGPPFIRFYAGGPLVFQAGIRLGALCLIDPKPRNFSLGDCAELLEMAERVVDVIAAEWFGTKTTEGASPTS